MFVLTGETLSSITEVPALGPDSRVEIHMNRFLVVPVLATTLYLAGCASMMQTGEGVIRSLTPSGDGVLSRIGNLAADVHKNVRGSVFRDKTLVPNDPAASAASPEEIDEANKKK